MKKIFLIIGTICLLITFYGFHVFQKEEKEEPTYNLIRVNIEGAVLLPGVYQVALETTLNDLIGYAGGFSANANTTSLDVNKLVKSNEKYYIPFITKNENVVKEEETLININKASQEELMKLSGIGQQKALEIINYRQENGPFKAIEELMDVKGIGASVYAKIKEQITV